MQPAAMQKNLRVQKVGREREAWIGRRYPALTPSWMSTGQVRELARRTRRGNFSWELFGAESTPNRNTFLDPPTMARKTFPSNPREIRVLTDWRLKSRRRA